MSLELNFSRIARPLPLLPALSPPAVVTAIQFSSQRSPNLDFTKIEPLGLDYNKGHLIPPELTHIVLNEIVGL
jgi:hypothetical protein